MIFKNRLKEINKPKLDLFHRAGYDDKIQIILRTAAKEGEKKHILQKKKKRGTKVFKQTIHSRRGIKIGINLKRQANDLMNWDLGDLHRNR